MGNEAIGLGAIDAGISGVYAYPGTPSTEITEFIQEHPLAKERNIHRRWCTNEKTAYEGALGMSYAGKRALVCMKHVGLNVAADAFINSTFTGVNGGLVLVVADDPSMHSSQNEQDTRFYGSFAMIPILEPSNQQEAYDMMRNAFELSEAIHYPVLFRITTRLAHSRSGVVQKLSPAEEKNLSFPPDLRQFVLLPAIARQRYKLLLNQQDDFLQRSEQSPYNQYFPGKDPSLGIICCGIALNYLLENYPDNTCPYALIKIGQYPVPRTLIRRLEKECDELLVLEEGYPLLEEMLTDFFGKGKRIRGRLDGTLPRAGELSPDRVAQALQRKYKAGPDVPGVVVNRPPSLCAGCGHQDLFRALNEALEPWGDGHVFSDIGCYTLGALPPYRSINSCVDMGASVTMAKGAADAGLFPSLAVVGDSTFTHSGMTGLLDAVNDDANVVIIISDNQSVSMTGGQDSSATGHLEAICRGLGVHPDHIRTLVPHKKNHEEMVRIIREEIHYPGVSVIIPTRECLQRSARLMRAERSVTKNNCTSTKKPNP